MAHNLSETNGKASMMYVGAKPWHGLGTELDNPATSQEAMRAAGLDWQVNMEPVYLGDGSQVPGARAAVRQDTNAVLGVMSEWYTPLQNETAFAFMDGLLGADSIRYHTAGALGRGERVWMLAKLDGEIRVAGSEDVTEKYLLLTNGHNGSHAGKIFFTPIRVVCQNTLTAAVSAKAKSCVTLYHMPVIERRLVEARNTLGLADAYFAKFGQAADAMAGVKLNTARATRYFESVFVMPEEPEKKKETADNVRRNRAKALTLFDNGMGADIRGVRHTLWTAYNAVTEFVDHAEVKATKTKSLEENRAARLSSMWFGAGSQLKADAFEKAMAFVSAN